MTTPRCCGAAGIFGALMVALASSAIATAQGSGRISQELVVAVAVNAKGSVSGVSVLSEVDERVELAVEQALKLWRFHPASQGGTPMPARIALRVLASIDPVFASVTLRSPEAIQKNLSPYYPYEAMRDRSESKIELIVSVDEHGRTTAIVPKKVLVSGGDLAHAKRFLEHAAGTAACWQLQPATVAGSSKSGRYIAPFSFDLPDELFESPYRPRVRLPLVDVTNDFELRFENFRCPERIDPEAASP